MKLSRRVRTLFLVLAALAIVALIAAAVRLVLQPVPAVVLVSLLVVTAIVSRVLGKRIAPNTILELDLERGIVEHTPSEAVGRLAARGSLVLRDVVEALDRAGSDRRVAGLVARLGNSDVGVAQAQELRDAIKRFAATGKRTISFAETFGESKLALIDYYLASAFDEVHLQPNGEVNIGGLVRRRPFLRGFFDRFDITPEFDHRKEYKAAKYLFTEKGFVEPDREATTAVANSQMQQIVRGIAADRRLGESDVWRLIDRSPLLPTEGLEAGLIDDLSYRDEVNGLMKGERGRLLYVDRYLKRAGRPHKRGPTIALIYGAGSVQRGKSRPDPLTRGSSLGSDDVSAAFRTAIENKRVKAIILRIDSPGGSAVASEVVRRETVRAMEAGKPVVATMGDVAGSGGYWVASSAHRIVAQPGTITGSIGVVFGKLVTAAAWKRVGINWDEIHIGRNATFMTPDRPWSDSERQRADAFLDFVYDGFKERVAEGRSMDLSQVEDIARGRIWSGEDARELGLVDELGGMDRALDLAKEAVGIAPDETVKLVEFPRKRALQIPAAQENSEAASIVRQFLAFVQPLTAVSGGGSERVVTMPHVSAR